MAPQELYLQAAEALSGILSNLGVNHAFIRGFAISLLGGTRATADIDIEIDAADMMDLRNCYSRPSSRNIGSNQDQTSIRKLRQDLEDIGFLLGWLAERDKKVDFMAYSSLHVDRLYSAVGSLRKYWKGAGRDDLVQLLDLVLEVDDQKVMED
ncbi:hypothetical protein QBC38DRAFT_546497 [Podospora fimiseda]|uniref:Uncharacterized protein n=1 Tax=Podospora fimiseda TaxID=252190 RepID=A0AAN7BM58_9PEZI|nr:hypothetical protein QBC38DRAFT_546497 [Podospora fimiseda]